MELQGDSRLISKKKKIISPSDDNNWRPWSELPETLLRQITNLLGDIDYLTFACVCRTWRLYAVANKQGFMASQPPLVVLFLHRGSKKFCYFYSIVDQRLFKALLPSLIGKELFGVSFGYLIIVDKKKISVSEIWLLNPFTGHELFFPCPPNQFQYVTLASLATPLPEFIIICFSRECLQFRRSTDVNWTQYKYDNPNMIYSFAFFNGKIYISNNEGIRVLNLNPLHPHLTLLNVKGNANVYPGLWQLLCFDKQLLLISGCSDYEVYELNFLKMELVKIPNLGDQALFQDGSKYSALSNITSWEAVGIPPSNNCIYSISEYDSDYSVKFLRGERYIPPRCNKFWYFPHQSCRVDSLCED
ncbi:hypothetical protein CMV_024179 [Castanea mollissima]|uniref:F-box domain-containing protein n=1 Tax=Castanea mollissima TaxID=60419 RepID=A0A8J4QG14_9ROSI|nr:hypothetical protein CMV_024179 [Castanea mollissima]